MKVIVCIKEVREWQVGLQKGPAGVLVRVNPADLTALEEALTLRDKFGGEVVALSVGTDERVLRRALSSGADRAILLDHTKQWDGDWYTTSLILSQAALRIGFDLILTGAWRIDEIEGLVGTAIAEHLKIPVLTHALGIEILRSPGEISVQVTKRLSKGRRQIFESHLPCVVTVEQELNQPRYIPIFSRCYREGLVKEVEHMTLHQLGVIRETLLPRTKTMEVKELKPRTRFGVKVTGLSIGEKLRLLKGDVPKSGGKKEVVANESQIAVNKLIGKLYEWLKEEKP